MVIAKSSQAHKTQNTKENIMKTRNIGFWTIAALAAGLLVAAAAYSETERFSARLVGVNEVPPINTDGRANFQMAIGPGAITFSLTFSGLSSPLAVAHTHFGVPKVNGGVMIFLCGGGGQPACPATTSGTITGTITAANVVGPTTQGVAAGDLNTALELLRDGFSYANMHTTNFPSGEIRGQVRRGAGHTRPGD